ncbi:oligosaccharide flippase family protein [Natrinema salaciae]|uniref:Membrane protein involved in the export of O-antigen and teichoic acid n=1 Tax=Natrinema salaciae TaxID=1186196 RepID=A0A1H9IKI5_9EURY|nr:polysaccharide biosynthesis C-terminal domain-containing protein [Natrinema salaciae]SEQ75120.1 Membrane protein involved in the export of O-antigen and teichoic acid [Natrinema salaciae]
MDRSIVSGILSVSASKFIALVVGLLSKPLLARLLGPEQFGEYATVMAVQGIFMIFVSAGISDGVRKYVAEDRHEDGWKATVIGFYLRTATVLAIGGAIVLAGVTYSGFFATVFEPRFSSYFYLLVVLVITAQYWEFARKSLMGLGLERYSEPLKILYTISFPLVALPLIATGSGVIGAIIGQIVATALAAVGGLLLLHWRDSLRNVFHQPPDTFPRMEMVTFNSLSIALIFLLMSLYHIDILMLQGWIGGDQVGYYKAALEFAEFLWFAPLVLQTVFVHSTSELWSQGETERISQLAARATRYTFLLTAVMSIGIAALAADVIPVYWSYGMEPVGPLLLLLPGSLGFALARPILAISQGKGELRYPIAATGVAAVINLVLNLLLIPRYGMHGAAVATSSGYASMTVFHVWSARKIGFDPLADARIGRITLASLIAAVPIFALESAISSVIAVPYVGALPVSILIVPPLGLGLFLLAAIGVGALGVFELLEILTEFPDPIGSLSNTICRRLRRTEAESTTLE